MKFIEDGNLKEWIRVTLVILGITLVIGSVHKGLGSAASKIVFIAGIVIAAVGGYASQAHMLKIKPFDNSYKKARDSHKEKDDDEKKSSPL